MTREWRSVTIYILNYCFFVKKNKGQWNAKSGPKVADGNVAMREKKFGTFGVEMRATGRNWSNFAH